jgi:hypothetical protein
VREGVECGGGREEGRGGLGGGGGGRVSGVERGGGSWMKTLSRQEGRTFWYPDLPNHLFTGV